MGLMNGKKGVVLGVANDRSLAWFIAERLFKEGAEIGFSHLPGEKMERRVRKLAETTNSKLIHPCDLTNDDDVRSFFTKTKETYGQIDFLVHAVAFANHQALTNRFYKTTREDFKQAMDISAY